MQISNFIVIDDDLSYKRIKGGVYSHAVNGEVYFPLETSIPIIRKGKGCVGIGMVTKNVMSKASSTITFTVADVSKEAAKAYYSLYRNQVTMGEQDDPYDDGSDAIIPGMMASTTPSVSRRPSYDRGFRSSSLSDYMDD